MNGENMVNYKGETSKLIKKNEIKHEQIYCLKITSKTFTCYNFRISIYLISTTTLCCMEIEPTTNYKDMPEFKFMIMMDKKYAHAWNFTYLALLTMSPGYDCSFS